MLKRNVMSERNKRLQEQGIKKPGSLIKQSPEERRLKYALARQAGHTPTKSAYLRELWSTHFFPQIHREVPSKEERKCMGIFHNPKYSSDGTKYYCELCHKYIKIGKMEKHNLVHANPVNHPDYDNSRHGWICKYCGALVQSSFGPMIICPKCRKRCSDGVIVPHTHAQNWKECEEMKRNPKAFWTSYGKAGGGSIGALARLQPKSSPATLQCNFCGKVFKKNLGSRTFEVTCPKCHETDVEIVRNPGAAWHKITLKDADFYAKNAGKKSTKEWFRSQGYAQQVAIDESKRLGMPNPIKGLKKYSWMLVPAIIVGLIWWKNRKPTPINVQVLDTTAKTN